MKRLIISLFAIVLAVQIHGQGMVLPGEGHIQVEDLKSKLNLNMDISRLSLSELRVLRNAPAARQGYVFKASELRSIFLSTSWYLDLAVKRQNGKMPAIKYTAAETAFMNRIKAREAELSKKNYAPAGGGIVNPDNIINPAHLTTFNPQLKAALQRQGFGIVPTDQEQLFQIYEENMYTQFPSFITTDLYLQLFHMYFDTTLRKVEESTLLGAMTDYSRYMYNKMMDYAARTSNAKLKAAAEWNIVFFDVAQSLFTGQIPQVSDQTLKETANSELRQVYEEIDDYSTYLGYVKVKFNYSLFRPRGHYTRSDAAKRYFRGMMWLQTVPFGSDIEEQMLRAAIIAETMRGDAQALRLYDRVDAPIRFLMGEPDNVTILQMGEIMAKAGANAQKMASDDNAFVTVRQQIDALGETQTRIRPIFERTSHVKINVMPQRYTPDAEVLLKTVDYDNDPTLRDVPMGLDFMAAIGVQPAHDILFGELGVQNQWSKFGNYLSAMTTRMGEINWEQTIYNRWEAALRELCVAKDARQPYFMKTSQWDKKNLNAALASWAELKHDAILYAKQPFGAECGGGDDLSTPVTKSYVEPNIAFWTKAVALIDALTSTLDRYQLLNKETRELADEVKGEAKFLLDISKKELSGKQVTDEEYETMRIIGAQYEHITLGLVAEDDQTLEGWYQVTGADKNVAIVADVYTANADNNPEKSILYEAVGPADEIYVIVEIDGMLYLTRGAVFSYREFKRPIGDPRLTDEEWQEMLPSEPTLGVPSWMKEIIVPIERPESNREVFYSSEC